MRIKINYCHRSLKFHLALKQGGFSGKEIPALLKKLERTQEKIERVELDGETESFTFSRQIYLLANLLSRLSGAPLIISGKKTTEPSFPDYRKRCCL